MDHLDLSYSNLPIFFLPLFLLLCRFSTIVCITIVLRGIIDCINHIYFNDKLRFAKQKNVL